MCACPIYLEMLEMSHTYTQHRMQKSLLQTTQQLQREVVTRNKSSRGLFLYQAEIKAQDFYMGGKEKETKICLVYPTKI